jgi:hypothetical protein
LLTLLKWERLIGSMGMSDWLMDFNTLVAIGCYGMRVHDYCYHENSVGKEVDGGLKVNEDESEIWANVSVVSKL